MHIEEGQLVFRPYTPLGDRELGEVLAVSDGVARIEWFDGSLGRMDVESLLTVSARPSPRAPTPRGRRQARRRDPLRAARARA